MTQDVTFKIISKSDNRIYLRGQVDLDTIDEDYNAGDFEYEQNNGFMGSHIPSYWKVDGENLSYEYDMFIQSIDWQMFRQTLFDFANESKTFDCGDYILHINID